MSHSQGRGTAVGDSPIWDGSKWISGSPGAFVLGYDYVIQNKAQLEAAAASIVGNVITLFPSSYLIAGNIDLTGAGTSGFDAVIKMAPGSRLVGAVPFLYNISGNSADAIISTADTGVSIVSNLTITQGGAGCLLDVFGDASSSTLINDVSGVGSAGMEVFTEGIVTFERCGFVGADTLIMVEGDVTRLTLRNVSVSGGNRILVVGAFTVGTVFFQNVYNAATPQGTENIQVTSGADVSVLHLNACDLLASGSASVQIDSGSDVALLKVTNSIFNRRVNVAGNVSECDLLGNTVSVSGGQGFNFENTCNITSARISQNTVLGGNINLNGNMLAMKISQNTIDAGGGTCIAKAGAGITQDVYTNNTLVAGNEFSCFSGITPSTQGAGTSAAFTLMRENMFRNSAGTQQRLLNETPINTAAP